MRAFSRFILRYAGWVSLVGTILAVVGGYFTVQLYKNLRTDLEELLPTTARSVIDLQEVSKRLQSIDSLAVLIFTDSSLAGKRFQVDLARCLETYPKETISSVEYKMDRELQFFRERQALYMDLGDLVKIRNYVRDRIEYERDLYNPLNIFSQKEIPEPKLDFNALKAKYQKKLSAYERFPEGYYGTPDGKKRVVLANMPGKTSGIAQVHKLRAAVDECVASLKPGDYAPDMRVKFTGGVEDTLEEHHALIEDLELSTVIVTLLVTMAMVLFFRNLRATMALVWSLFMGTFWTFGISYFAVGYLNANSAFLGSIVIGNGINFGIIYLARYLEERRRGTSNERAVLESMRQTATSTWTAAGAAGLSYGSLILTGFRGFRQFGIIGLIGMVLCWISAFTLLPAYLTLFDRIRPLVRGRVKPPASPLAGAVAGIVNARPGLIWGISLILTFLSIGMFTRYSPDIIETNLGKLRNKESLTKGAAFLSKNLDEIFQRYLSPMVILPHTVRDARRIAEKLREKKEEQGPNSMIASVQTMDDFVPSHQEEKIKLLHEIKDMLPPKLLHRMSDEDQKLVATYFTPAVFQPIRLQDLPDLVIKKFTERDGSIGKLVLVEPPLNQDTAQGGKLIQLIHDLRETADSVEPGVPLAGGLPITSDMIEAVTRDGPRATFFAFLAVVLLVVLLFRNLQTISLILFALMMGVVWLAGLILGLDLKINFLNFIALPITFGIGVDYGVNIFQRYREEGAGSILKVIRNTGGAVALCSFTTIVGYMSLLIAGNQGFVSFGRLAVAGEITCVIAAVVSLPAYLTWKARKRGLATFAKAGASNSAHGRRPPEPRAEL